MPTPTINREVFSKDPSQRKLENEGVADVNDGRTDEDIEVLKYELDTFVCSGQYADGLETILRSFLGNLSRPEQPAVWVSGFYGSGKSHLVKMLRALWVNQAFQDGQRAREIANLPTEVTDLLRELDNAGKRLGGLRAASGTLGAGSEQSVRLALLSIILKSVRLPEDYSAASLMLWLQDEGKLEAVGQHLAADGRDLTHELHHMYVSIHLHAAIHSAIPELRKDAIEIGDLINNQFPPKEDVTSAELVDTVQRALSGTRGGKIPLTLVVLDEVQQYIGQNDDRSMAVQEATQAVSKRFAGRLVFIGTGQSALSGTAKIQRLEGRFPVRVQLRDEDVDEVVRKVVLEKKPSAVPALETIRDNNVGELAKHLADTQIKRQPRDQADFARDYPILPVRRRFWEHALRALDTTSVKSQLRNQLGLVHRVVQTNLDAPLGHVVPADALFFESAPSLVQSRALPRRVYDFTVNGEESDDNDVRIAARAVGLVYLINQIKKDPTNTALGIRADVATVADLLVSDLNAGSSALRARLPGLMDACDLLDLIDGEYSIQTKESADWRDSFMQERGALGGDQYRLDAERDERVRQAVSAALRDIKLQQGEAKVSRSVLLSTGSEMPTNTDNNIVAWAPGLSYQQDDIEQAAREAGEASPMLFVYLPLDNSDELRRQLIEFKAAEATINKKVASNTADGQGAKATMETIRQAADQAIDAIVARVVARAHVYQGGGNEVVGNGLRALVEDGARRSLIRLYPKFEMANHGGWGRALDAARRGSPDAFKHVGHAGELKEHPVARKVLEAIGSNKTGKELREAFTKGRPYGWSEDAVDATLLALLQGSFLRAEDARGRPANPKELNKTELGRTTFIPENVRVSAGQKLAARALFQEVGVRATSGAELESLDEFYAALDALAKRAGGEPPLPAAPQLPPALKDVATLPSTNERLLRTVEAADLLRPLLEEWRGLAALADQRQRHYAELTRLLAQVERLPDSQAKAELLAETEALRTNRLLLAPSHPTELLTKSASDLLRQRITQLEAAYAQAYERGIAYWKSNPHYEALSPEQRNDLLRAEQLTESQRPDFAHGSTEEILATLDANHLGQLQTQVDAVAARFDKVAEAAKRLATPDAPKARKVHLVRRELHTEADVAKWLEEAGTALRAGLGGGGPVRPD